MAMELSLAEAGVEPQRTWVAEGSQEWATGEALATGAVPVEVTTDRAPAYPRVIDERVPTALHTTAQYANNTIEADHGRLKARLRPMRGLKTFRSARILATGHAFIQNLKRGHYDIATDAPAHHRLPAAFNELALAI